MGHLSPRGRLVRVRARQRAAALAMAVWLLVGCVSEDSRDQGSAPRTSTGSLAPTHTAQAPTSSPAPSPGSSDGADGQPGGGPDAESDSRRGTEADGEPGPEPDAGRLLEVPDTTNAATLARQLTSATATLRDQQATVADVQRAGEFQQLAVRALLAAPVPFRRSVLARLDSDAESITEGAVRAGAALRSTTSPQTRLPRWRIVRPPRMGELLAHYRAAQRRSGVHWTYLAAIHLVETRMGRIRGVSSAGARGPMQFIPSTWALYGAGGDINDPGDAIMAAARLLVANGAPADMAEALFHYNPATWYVRAVSEYAQAMQRTPYAYRGFWHWRVLYRHAAGTYVLSVGYPEVRPVLLADRPDTRRPLLSSVR